MALKGNSVLNRRWLQFGILGLIWAFAAQWAIVQPSRDDLQQRNYDWMALSSLTSPDFWLYPVERNPRLRFQAISASLNDVQFLADGQRGWAVGDGGTIVTTTNGGGQWTSQTSGTGQNLTSVQFLADGQRGWAVGSGGTIVTTTNGGGQWRVSRTVRWERSLAPWFWGLTVAVLLTLLLGIGQAVLGALSQLASSDGPKRSLADDELGAAPRVLALSRMLRNDGTKPPIVVAIDGEWGTGKSSIMRFLETDLKAHGCTSAWFNAWHHQSDEQLFAALLDAIRRDVVPPLPRFWMWLRYLARLFVLRAGRHPIRVAVVLFGAVTAAAFCVALIHSVASADSRSRLPATHLESVVDGYRVFMATGEKRPSKVEQIRDERVESRLDVTSGSTAATLARVPLYRESDDADRRPPNLRERLRDLYQRKPIWTAVLTALVALVPLVLALSKFIEAFPKPAAIRSATAFLRNRASERETSYRYRFERDFRDVTKALSPYRLVVFVDDLDRCSPQATAALLEAINFLVECGEIIVVLGIARQMVERNLGLAYADLAAESAEGAADAREHRQRFAEHFLRKIVNLRVQVTKVDAAAAARLVLSKRSPSIQLQIERVAVPKRYLLLDAVLPVIGGTLAGTCVVLAALWFGQRLQQPVVEQSVSKEQPAISGPEPVTPTERRFPSLNAVWVSRDKSAVAIGHDGLILRADGTEAMKWKALQPPAFGAWTSLGGSGVAGGPLLAAGPKVELAQSQDSGRSWTSISTFFIEYLPDDTRRKQINALRLSDEEKRRISTIGVMRTDIAQWRAFDLASWLDQMVKDWTRRPSLGELRTLRGQPTQTTNVLANDVSGVGVGVWYEPNAAQLRTIQQRRFVNEAARRRQSFGVVKDSKRSADQIPVFFIIERLRQLTALPDGGIAIAVPRRDPFLVGQENARSVTVAGSFDTESSNYLGSTSGLIDVATDRLGRWAAAVGESGLMLIQQPAKERQQADWYGVRPHTSKRLNAVSLVESGRGWIAGEQGVVLLTRDFGLHWQLIHLPGMPTLTDVQFVNDASGWMTDASGKVWKTADGGKRWRAVDVATSALHHLHFANQLLGWAVGEQGNIFVTRDGGLRWSKQDSGSTQALRSVHFADSRFGMVTGDDGMIRYTNDGGGSWSVVPEAGIDRNIPPPERVEAPTAVEPRSDEVRPRWEVWLLVLVGVVIAVRTMFVLSRERRFSTTDTQDVGWSMEAWGATLAFSQVTPRELRRFQNRLRHMVASMSLAPSGTPIPVPKLREFPGAFQRAWYRRWSLVAERRSLATEFGDLTGARVVAMLSMLTIAHDVDGWKAVLAAALNIVALEKRTQDTSASLLSLRQTVDDLTMIGNFNAADVADAILDSVRRHEAAAATDLTRYGLAALSSLDQRASRNWQQLLALYESLYGSPRRAVRPPSQPLAYV